jgi:RNA polymerase sigma-70 factor (ECF subfamily)
LAEKHDAGTALWKLLQELEKLHGILRRFAPNPADCDDLIQRARERLLSNPPRNPVRSPELYLLRMARNVGIDHLRRQKRERLVPLDSAPEHELVDERLSPADEAALEQERAILRAIMRTLPPRCREVFRLNREEGLDHREIGRRLNISVSTVKNHLARAAIHFEHELQRLENEGVVERDP